jgi:hypothetical protein
MIYLQWASWALLVLSGYFCVLNFYLSFLRYPMHLWRGLPKESYRFVSGIPILASLIVYLLLRYARLPPVLEVAAIGLIAIDTGGIHWAIGNIIYQSLRYVVVGGAVKRFIASPYMIELTRPWKLITLSIGIGLLIWGSFYYAAPDWDIPISLIMAFFAYLTAGWSMHVMVERNWKRFPMMMLATWWTVDGCYSLYWFFRNPLALDYMRSANAPASLSLYWMCGLLWYWNGSVKAFFETVKLASSLTSLAKIILKALVCLALIFIAYLAYYWWNIAKLRAFCEELKPGTSVSELQRIGARHGINPSWLRGDSVFDAASKQWRYYVPATSSVGANVCAIRHDKATVISAEIEID